MTELLVWNFSALFCLFLKESKEKVCVMSQDPTSVR